MITFLVITLVLLQVKHWYVDFVVQTQEEVDNKGKYGNWAGIQHSLKHGIGTFIVLLMIAGFSYFWIVLMLAVFDFVTHYHIDWLKMNYGNRDITNKQFWSHLGLDQMAHQMIYLVIAALFVL